MWRDTGRNQPLGGRWRCRGRFSEPHPNVAPRGFATLVAMRRMLLDSDGSLRVTALIALVVLVPAVVLALASAGGWWAVAGIAAILTGCLVAMVRFG